MRRLACSVLVALATAAAGAAAVIPADASDVPRELESGTLARAKAIRAEVNARYGRMPGPKLVVSEASATGVIESFTLIAAGMDAARTVSAANGIWFAICPARARCPYPGRRSARPAADYLPRRLALELAARTFVETSADLVAVSLPTPRFTVLVIERVDLADHLPGLAYALRGVPPTSQLRVVDLLTRPHIFVGVALELTPAGGETFIAYPRWPDEGFSAEPPVPTPRRRSK
jgi:hypothetical protein